MTPIQYQLRELQDTYLQILAQIHYKLLHQQAKFPKIQSEHGQNDLEGQGQWPHPTHPPLSTQGVCLV